MNIAKSETGLPSSYRKDAQIEMQTTTGAGDWIVIAKFTSSTMGQSPAYFVKSIGDVSEINFNQYKALVIESVTPTMKNNGDWWHRAVN